MSRRGIDFRENWVNQNVIAADRRGSQAPRDGACNTVLRGRGSLNRQLLRHLWSSHHNGKLGKTIS
jgi:hypothetical protein